LLADEIDARHIDLSVYSNNLGLIMSKDEEMDTGIIDLEALRMKISRELKAASGAVVLDGHYAHEVAAPNETLIVFVLRKAPWALAEALRGRGYREAKIWENVEAEIMGVCTAEALETHKRRKVCEIDTTKATPEESLQKMLRRLQSKATCDGPVDWLSHPRTMELIKRSVPYSEMP
jgi:adenylate kinase